MDNGPVLHKCVGCPERILPQFGLTTGRDMPFAALCRACRQRIPTEAVCKAGHHRVVVEYRLLMIDTGDDGQILDQNTCLYLDGAFLVDIFPDLGRIFEGIDA